MKKTMMSYYIDIPAEPITADNIEEAKEHYSEALYIVDDAKSTVETLGEAIDLYEEEVSIIVQMVEDDESTEIDLADLKSGKRTFKEITDRLNRLRNMPIVTGLEGM